ncbi:hypothetical protein ASZ90_003237 [hydrocarbon metagenome]|uniref:Uncharacterized protein n=1 Tax=hydrocarbon metagenome TaxID=938273 RepID=A0A0W8G1K2_9ZZZZ
MSIIGFKRSIVFTSDEKRFLILGVSGKLKLLVAHTLRESYEIFRIIFVR